MQDLDELELAVAVAAAAAEGRKGGRSGSVSPS